MKTLIRADFEFSTEKENIKHCTGYVLCEDVQIKQGGGFTFGVHSIIIQKLIATNPDFEKIEQLAIQNCKLFEEETINIGSLADYHN